MCLQLGWSSHEHQPHLRSTFSQFAQEPAYLLHIAYQLTQPSTSAEARTGAGYHSCAAHVTLYHVYCCHQPVRSTYALQLLGKCR